MDAPDDVIIDAEDDRRDSRWWLVALMIMFFSLWLWREVAVRVARERIATRDAEIHSLIEKNAILTQRLEKLSRQTPAVAATDTTKRPDASHRP